VSAETIIVLLFISWLAAILLWLNAEMGWRAERDINDKYETWLGDLLEWLQESDPRRSDEGDSHD
jgi:hypothetical protein